MIDEKETGKLKPIGVVCNGHTPFRLANATPISAVLQTLLTPIPDKYRDREPVVGMMDLFKGKTVVPPSSEEKWSLLETTAHTMFKDLYPNANNQPVIKIWWFNSKERLEIIPESIYTLVVLIGLEDIESIPALPITGEWTSPKGHRYIYGNMRFGFIPSEDLVDSRAWRLSNDEMNERYGKH